MAFNIVSKIDNFVEIHNVLVSVNDKDKVEILVNALRKTNPEIRFYATGNTYQYLREKLDLNPKKELIAITDYTGQPEMQGGLVKTLDYKIYLGLLTETYNEAHNADLKKNKAVKFDLVICNLYPFSSVIQKEGVSLEEARANIDIGGPCMIRAAAKNFLRVAVVCDKADYKHLAEIIIHSNGKLDLATRFTLARKAFSYTTEYDKVIADFLLNKGSENLKKCYTF